MLFRSPQTCDKLHKAWQYNVPIKIEDGVACLQQGISKPIMGKGGKLMKCFHCGKNHQLENCPDINKVKKKEIIDAKKKHWEERRHREAAEKAKKTIPGQAYMQTAESKPDEDSQAGFESNWN